MLWPKGSTATDAQCDFCPTTDGEAPVRSPLTRYAIRLWVARIERRRVRTVDFSL